MQAVAAGTGAGLLWILLAGVLAHSARGYVWATVLAGVIGAAVSMVLARFGDRGVAVGVALASGFGVAIAMTVVIARWLAGQWLLW